MDQVFRTLRKNEYTLIGALIRVIHYEKTENIAACSCSKGVPKSTKTPPKEEERTGETPAYESATAPVSYIVFFISCMKNRALVHCHIPYLIKKNKR